jgi:hypothetical protein
MKGTTMLATLQCLGVVPSFISQQFSDDKFYENSQNAPFCERG